MSIIVSNNDSSLSAECTHHDTITECDCHVKKMLSFLKTFRLSIFHKKFMKEMDEIQFSDDDSIDLIRHCQKTFSIGKEIDFQNLFTEKPNIETYFRNFFCSLKQFYIELTKTQFDSFDDIKRIVMDEIKLKEFCNKICPICLLKFSFKEETIQLKCKHIFHQLCISEWLKKEDTCPTCRSNVMKGLDNNESYTCCGHFFFMRNYKPYKNYFTGAPEEFKCFTFNIMRIILCKASIS